MRTSTMLKMRRAAPVLIMLGLFSIAGVLRHEIAAQRARRVGTVAAAARVDGALRGDSGSGAVAVIGAGLGAFRPIVINFLALRAAALERQGRYFESVGIARAMTTLLPQLPRVWTFQATKLAYDISADAPVDERLAWMLEGVRILRDDAREFNQTSPRLYMTIALVFLHRIGGDADPAHRTYKDQLAAIFASRDAPELRASWRIDSDRLRSISDRYLSGDATSPATLDLRSPYVHALYWAEIGLELSRPDEDRAAHSGLSHYRAFALRELASRGVLLRQSGSPHFAMLPDPRIAPAAFATFDEQMDDYRGDPVVLADLRDDRERFVQWSVVNSAILGDFDGARAVFASTRAAAELPSFEEFLLSTLLGDTPRSASATRQELAIGLLRTAACLLVIEEPELELDLDRAAAGFVGLARLVDGGRGDREFAALRRGVIAALIRKWGASAENRVFAEMLAERAADQDGDAETIDDARPARLPDSLAPWGLEALDPSFRREIER